MAQIRHDGIAKDEISAEILKHTTYSLWNNVLFVKKHEL